MSYYYQHEYSFSYHGLQRCRERLDLKNWEDFKVKNEVMKLIKYSSYSFETGREIYIRAGNTQNYFVIDKKSKLIITCTKISAEKQLSLMNRGDF